MKLKLQFGLNEPPLLFDWPSRVDDFPGLVLYKKTKWEFVIYDDDDTGEAKYVFTFSRVQNYDPNWYATTYVDIDSLIASTKECGCGAKGGEGHFLFCPKWTRL